MRARLAEWIELAAALATPVFVLAAVLVWVRRPGVAGRDLGSLLLLAGLGCVLVVAYVRRRRDVERALRQLEVAESVRQDLKGEGDVSPYADSIRIASTVQEERLRRLEELRRRDPGSSPGSSAP